MEQQVIARHLTHQRVFPVRQDGNFRGARRLCAQSVYASTCSTLVRLKVIIPFYKIEGDHLLEE